MSGSAIATSVDVSGINIVTADPVTAPEAGAVLAATRDDRLAPADEEERGAAGAFAAHDVTRRETTLLEETRHVLGLPGAEAREQRDLVDDIRIRGRLRLDRR